MTEKHDDEARKERMENGAKQVATMQSEMFQSVTEEQNRALGRAKRMGGKHAALARLLEATGGPNAVQTWMAKETAMGTGSLDMIDAFAIATAMALAPATLSIPDVPGEALLTSILSQIFDIVTDVFDGKLRVEAQSIDENGNIHQTTFEGIARQRRAEYRKRQQEENRRAP